MIAKKNKNFLVGSQPSSGLYAWSVVGMLWLICFLNYADRQVISAIFPLLEHEFAFTKFQLGKKWGQGLILDKNLSIGTKSNDSLYQESNTDPIFPIFGFCKTGYGAGIFSSLFDYVEPHVRGSAAGLMNTVGWIGGALGPIVVGAVSTYGHGSAMSCMSAAISWSAMGYVAAAGLLSSVLMLERRK